MKRIHSLGVGCALVGAVAMMAFHRRPVEAPDNAGPIREHRTASPSPAESEPIPINVTALQLAGGKADVVDRWLETLDPAARDEALSIMTAETGRSDPQRAEYYARRISGGLLRSETVSLALAYRFDQDPDAALVILREETDSALKASIRARLLPALANRDAPAAARVLAKDEVIGNQELTSLLASTVQRWALQDPEAAATWLAEIEDNSLRQSAMAAFIGEWGRYDAPGLESWLDRNSTAVEFQSAYADWRDPWSPQQWEDWTNQSRVVESRTISGPCGDGGDSDLKAH